MESVTNFKLPWRLLREKLAIVNENNEILYESTLQMIESDDIVSHRVFYFREKKGKHDRLLTIILLLA